MLIAVLQRPHGQACCREKSQGRRHQSLASQDRLNVTSLASAFMGCVLVRWVEVEVLWAALHVVYVV